MIILEISKEKEVSISLLDDDGIVTHSVPIVTLAGGEMSPLYHARSHAEDRGWQAYGDWNTEGECPWIEVSPKPLTLAFVGGELDDQVAMNCAKTVGYETLSVVKQTPDPDAGKTYIAFSVALPLGWDWGESPF
jgi:hypothetical protein